MRDERAAADGVGGKGALWAGAAAGGMAQHWQSARAVQQSRATF